MGPSVGTDEGDVVGKCRIHNITQKLRLRLHYICCVFSLVFLQR